MAKGPRVPPQRATLTDGTFPRPQRRLNPQSQNSLNRLSAASAGYMWGEAYSYDGFGNLTGKTVTQAPVPAMGVSYDANNHQRGLTYDANGNHTRPVTTRPVTDGTLSALCCLASTSVFGGRPPLPGASRRRSALSKSVTKSSPPSGRPVCVLRRIASASASAPAAVR